MKDIKLESLEHASKVMTRLARRSQKHVVGVFSPAIINLEKEEVGENGLVGSLLFPCDGTITRVAIRVPNVTVKEPADISLELVVDNVSTTLSLSLKKEQSSTEYSLSVSAGSVLTLRAPVKSSILASMMFVPAVGNYKMEQYLLDNIESATDEGIRDAIDESATSGPAKG